MRILLFIYTIVMTLFFIAALTREAKASSEIEEQIRIEAFRQGVDPDLAVAVAIVESNLNPKAKGSLSEEGLFQLHPKFHSANPLIYSPHGNIVAGINYLSRVLAICSPKYGDAAFVCYNAGPYQRQPYKDVRRTEYYKRVTAEMKKLKRNAGGV